MTDQPVPLLEVRLCVGPLAMLPSNLPNHLGRKEAERQIDCAIEPLIALLNEWNGIADEGEAEAAMASARAGRREVVQ